VVSIPQEAFIPYGTGIKTSVLFLQKAPSENTYIFFSRIQKLGYDVKGQSVFKKDHRGKIIFDNQGNPKIDDDIDEIVDSYFLNQSNLNSFHLPDTEVVSRLDAEYYDPEITLFRDKLVAKNAVQLDELCEIITERDFVKINPESEINYIAISDVDYRTMQVVSCQTIKAYEAPSRASFIVHTNDIITAISGASTGTYKHCTALITEDEDGFICTNGFAILRNIKSIDRNFLLAYMRSSSFLNQVKRLMTGHAIPTISIDDLRKILVPLPSLEDQRQISKSISYIQNLRKESLRKGNEITLETDRLIGNFLSSD